MPGRRIPRTELRDELAAVIAAGRELPPDHDQALAEVFIDRVMATIAPPSRTRHLRTVLRKPRRLLGAVVLGLACLATASVLSIDHTSSSPSFPASVSPKQPGIAPLGKVPIPPAAPKIPLAPQLPAPNTAP